MSERDTDLERITARVHRELGEDGNAEVDRRAAADEAFRRRLEEAQRVDALVRSLMPLGERSDAELEEKLMRALESSGPVLGSRPAAGIADLAPAPVPGAAGGQARMRRPWRAVAGFALAAGIALALVIIPPQVAGPLRWETTVAADAYRGGGHPAAYEKSQLQAVSAALRGDVAARYAGLVPARPQWLPGRPVEWIVTAQVRDLGEGRLSIQVTARDAADRGGAPMEWNRKYEDLDACRGGMTALAETIAAGLSDARP